MQGGPVISNFNRQSHARSSQNPSIRRGTQARGRGSTRLTRLRSRLPSQSTRTSHRERRAIFPPDMDLDMVEYLHNLQFFFAVSLEMLIDIFLQVLFLFFTWLHDV